MSDAILPSSLDVRRARARLERKLRHTREELRESLDRLAEVSTTTTAATLQAGKQHWRGRRLYPERSFVRRHPLAIAALVATAVTVALWAYASGTRSFTRRS
jgi:anti-sigma factor RsiW